MNKKLIIGIIIGLVLGSVSVYAGTKFYASDIAVSAPTGSNLGNDATLQDSLDELYSIADKYDELKTKISSLKSDVINEMYPVGSIYISTDIKTASAVATKLGGTWEAYGSGRTLVSSGSNGVTNYTAGSTGGSSTTTLSTSNLPSHTHTYTPSGNITSVFNTGGSALVIGANSTTSVLNGYGLSATQGGGWWFDHNKNTSGIKSTFTGESKYTTGCTNCSGTPFSVQNPYIVVYMYKRIK